MRQHVVQTLKRVPRSEEDTTSEAIELVWEIDLPGPTRASTGEHRARTSLTPQPSQG